MTATAPASYLTSVIKDDEADANALFMELVQAELDNEDEGREGRQDRILALRNKLNDTTLSDAISLLTEEETRLREQRMEKWSGKYVLPAGSLGLGIGWNAMLIEGQAPESLILGSLAVQLGMALGSLRFHTRKALRDRERFAANLLPVLREIQRYRDALAAAIAEEEARQRRLRRAHGYSMEKELYNRYWKSARADKAYNNYSKKTYNNYKYATERAYWESVTRDITG